MDCAAVAMLAKSCHFDVDVHRVQMIMLHQLHRYSSNGMIMLSENRMYSTSDYYSRGLYVP